MKIYLKSKIIILSLIPIVISSIGLFYLSSKLESFRILPINFQTIFILAFFSLIATTCSVLRLTSIYKAFDVKIYRYEISFIQSFSQFISNFIPSAIVHIFIKTYLLSRIQSDSFFKVSKYVIIDLSLALSIYISFFIIINNLFLGLLFFLIIFILSILINKNLYISVIYGITSCALIFLLYLVLFDFYISTNSDVKNSLLLSVSLYVGNIVSALPISIGGLGLREIISSFYYNFQTGIDSAIINNIILSGSLTIMMLNGFSQFMLSLYYFYMKNYTKDVSNDSF